MKPLPLHPMKFLRGAVMRAKVLWIVALVVMLCVVVGPAGAKKDDLYEHYETLTAVVNKVLENYVTEVDKEKLFYGAYEGMLHTLDPYSAFLPPPSKEDLEIDTRGEFGGIGIEITQDENKVLTVVTPLEGTPAFNAGVLAGDKIWKIDGKTTEGMSLTDAVKKLRGKKGTAVTITVIHEAEPRKPVDIKIVRDIIKIRSIVDVRMIDEKEKIGYIRMTQFQERTAQDLDKAMNDLLGQGMRALVLDLRFNPGGLLDSAVEVCKRFIAKGTIVSTKGRNRANEKVFSADGTAAYPPIPMAVLVTGQSASASEIVAGALQDHKRAVIVGTRTFGKGSVQTVLPLENGKSAMRLTTAYYYTPSGRCIHRKPDATEKDDWGIYPDIEVKMAPKEVVQLWKQWRERHIEENRPAGTSAKPNGSGKNANEQPAQTHPAGEAQPEGQTQPDGQIQPDKTHPEDELEEIELQMDAPGDSAAREPEEGPFVDRQLEAARLFLAGQLFTESRVAGSK